MVRKRFRPFLKAVCIACSVMFSVGNIASAASSLEEIPKTELGTKETKADETETNEVEAEPSAEPETEETMEAADAEESADEPDAVDNEEENSDEHEAERMEEPEVSVGEEEISSDGEEEPGDEDEEPDDQQEVSESPHERVADFICEEIGLSNSEIFVGEEAVIVLHGIHAEGVERLEVTVNGPSSDNYTAECSGLSLETENADTGFGSLFKAVSEHIGDALSEEKDMKIKIPINRFEENYVFLVTVKAYDEDGTLCYENSRDLSLKVAVPESEGAALSYDKPIYQNGEVIQASFHGMENSWADQAVLIYDVPEGAAVTGVNIPSYSGSCLVEVRDSSGNWKKWEEESDGNAVKAVQITFSGLDGMHQKDDMILEMKAKESCDADTSLQTIYEKGNVRVEKYAQAHLKIQTEDVKVSFAQTPEKPSRADEISQKIHILYQNPVDSRITYTLDDSVKIKSLEIGSNTYLEGGKAVIFFADGETELPIMTSMDLSSYVGVRKIVFQPKVKAYAGMEANITTVLEVKQNTDAFTCGVDVTTGLGDMEKTVSKSITSEVLGCLIQKPEVFHEKRVVGFEEEFVVSFQSLGMNSYGLTTEFESELMVPDFVEIEDLQLPAVSGTDKIKVFVRTEDGEKAIGEYAPGTKVIIGENGLHAVILRMQAPEHMLESTSSGSITICNNAKQNKKNYFGFRMNSRSTMGEIQYQESSRINGVTFEIYKPTEIIPEDTPVPTPVPVIPEETPAPEATPTPEPAKPGPTDEERAEEERIKEEARKEALRKEQELREKQKAILAARIEAIHAEAFSNGGSKKQSTKSQKDVNQYGMSPIPEQIILNTVPMLTEQL